MNIHRAVLLFAAAMAWPAAAQVWDNTGNAKLNGVYYFRQVIFTTTDSVSIYGNITFNNGSYTVSGAQFFDCNNTSGCRLGAYSPSGTYSIGANGYGFLSDALLGSPVYGLVGANGVFVGSSSESAGTDLFIAAPVGGQSLSTFQGSYTMAYLYPATRVPYDALLQMSPNGAGTIGTVNVTAYGNSSTASTQSLSNVKYIASNNAFVLTFPTSSSALVSGQEYLYSTPDGSFVFGGSPQDFDIVVGVKNGVTGPGFGGLYYEAGMDADNSQIAATGYSSLTSYYGSFTANGGNIIGHQRQNIGDVTGNSYTYSDSYPAGSSGSYSDTYLFKQFISGGGGAVRIGLGIGPYLGVTVAVQAPAVTGSGVFLNPTGVVNAASSAPFTAGLARGELMTLVGSNIGPSTLQVASTLPFPKTLGNVQVLVNGLPAPIYYVSPSQISAVVPWGTNTSIAQIQVSNNGVLSNAVTSFVYKTAPGVFTIPPGGIGYAAAEHADGSLVSAARPAQIGETIAVFLTGLGDVFPSALDGAAAVGASATTNKITAYVGGTAATVAYAGLAPGLAALYQLNVTIPAGLTLGDNYLDIAGPDSYTTEALISVGSGSSAVGEKPVPAASRGKRSARRVSAFGTAPRPAVQ